MRFLSRMLTAAAFAALLVGILGLLFVAVFVAPASAAVPGYRWTVHRMSQVLWGVTDGGLLTGGNFTATNASTTRQAFGSTTVNAINTAPVAGALVQTYFIINGSAQNFTLPAPSTVPVNMPITIVDAAGKAGSNTIAVNSSAGNINGVASVNISTAYGQKTYRSNGTNYFAQ